MPKPWEMYGGQSGEDDQTLKPWERFSAQAPEQKEGIGKTIFDQSMQGATFGFSDEASDAIGALIAGGLDPEMTIGQAYQQARQLTKESQARQFDQHPGVSIAANIAGGLLTGGAAASTRAGTAIGNSLRTGNTAARAVKGAASGAATGGLYGAGAGEDGARGESAARGALFGGAVGGALPLAGARLSKLNVKKTYPTFQEVKKASQASYQKARELGGSFKPEATDELIRTAAREIPTDQFASDVIGTDEVTDFVSRLTKKGGQPMTLETFEELDKKLGDLAHRNYISAPDISRRYNNLQNALRSVVENPNSAQGTTEGLQAFREGTRLWSISSKMRDVERVLDDAQYFEVPATAIKTGFRRIARDDSKMRGYSKAEQKAIQMAATTGRTEGLLKTFGSKLFAIGAGLVGGPQGAALGYAASTLGREGAEALKSADAAKVSRLLAERSGMVTQKKRLQLPPEIMKKIMAMPPKAARALLDQLNAQP